MENMVLGDALQARVPVSLDFDTTALPGSTQPTALPVVSLSDGILVTVTPPNGNLISSPIITGTSVVTPTSTATLTSTSLVSASSTQAANANSSAKSSGVSSTTLIAILVPVCVVLAAVPTAAYLFYLRRRDKKQRAEAEALRGRGANSSSGATAEALLMRRSMSAASQHERKFASVSSAELEMGAAGAALEKSVTNSSEHTSGNIFAPATHGPIGRRSPSGSMRSQQRPGFTLPPIVSDSPTLPPLDFGESDTGSLAPLTHTTSPKPTVPATLPTFAPVPPKQRAPNPALAPGRQNDTTESSENSSWPLPADGLRDSASIYSSATNDRVVSHQLQSKPLPTIMAKEASSSSGGPAAVPRPQLQQPQQTGPRESSIAYGVPPIPPSPVVDSLVGDRRSGATRKRDSDAVSELSYAPSMRSRRDTRRDTDAISVISAMSREER